jgi:hypothetical protein
MASVPTPKPGSQAGAGRGAVVHLDTHGPQSTLALRQAQSGRLDGQREVATVDAQPELAAQVVGALARVAVGPVGGQVAVGGPELRQLLEGRDLGHVDDEVHGCALRPRLDARQAVDREVSERVGGRQRRHERQQCRGEGDERLHRETSWRSARAWVA